MLMQVFLNKNEFRVNPQGLFKKNVFNVNPQAGEVGIIRQGTPRIQFLIYIL
jgi:hypothetical protein